MYLVLMLLLTAGAMAQQTDMDKVVKMQNQQKNELLARQTQESADLTTQINKMKEEDKQAYDKKLNGLDKNSPTYNQDRAKIIGEQAVISGRTDQLAKTSLARLKNEHEGQQVSMLKQHVANTNAIKNNMNDPKYQIQQKANNKLGILANQRNNVINNAEARKQGAQDFAQNKLKAQQQKELNQTVNFEKNQIAIDNALQKKQSDKLKGQMNNLKAPVMVSDLSRGDKLKEKNFKETQKLLAKQEKKTNALSKSLDKAQASDRAAVNKEIKKNNAAVAKNNKEIVKIVAKDQKSKTTSVVSKAKKTMKKIKPKKKG